MGFLTFTILEQKRFEALLQSLFFRTIGSPAGLGPGMFVHPLRIAVRVRVGRNIVS